MNYLRNWHWYDHPVIYGVGLLLVYVFAFAMCVYPFSWLTGYGP